MVLVWSAFWSIRDSKCGIWDLNRFIQNYKQNCIIYFNYRGNIYMFNFKENFKSNPLTVEKELLVAKK